MAYRRNPQVEAAPMQAETMLFNPGSNQFCLLNATAAFIWEQIDNSGDAHELAAKICERFADASPAEAEADVNKVVGELQSLGFINQA